MGQPKTGARSATQESENRRTKGCGPRVTPTHEAMHASVLSQRNCSHESVTSTPPRSQNPIELRLSAQLQGFPVAFLSSHVAAKERQFACIERLIPHGEYWRSLFFSVSQSPVSHSSPIAPSW